MVEEITLGKVLTTLPAGSISAGFFLLAKFPHLPYYISHGNRITTTARDSGATLLYNFTRKVKRSGILKEVRNRKFHKRTVSRIKRRASAIHREEKRVDVERQKKLGIL